MSSTLQAVAPVSSSSEIPERTLLVGLGLTSFAALLLELALTRLFSVVLFYHFAFLAISIALLGLGAGGVFAYLLKQRLALFQTRTLAARLCMANSVLVLVVLEIVLHVPVALTVTGKNFLHLSVLYLAAAVPFFLTGLLFSVVFARETWRVSRLYGADLSGGALACLAVVPLLNWIGGPNTILAAAVVMAAAAMVWAASSAARQAWREPRGLIRRIDRGEPCEPVDRRGLCEGHVPRSSLGGICALECAVARGSGPPGSGQGHRHRCRRFHLHHELRPGALARFGVGAAISCRLRRRWPMFCARAASSQLSGPGGGVDVLRAVANGSPSVTGIEINPIIANTIMRGRYADYSLHLYERPEVHIHVTDGRSYLRSTPQQFDVVQMTLVDTWASTAAGAFALSENNLYTVEAFREYFEHLKPDGMIAITRWEFRQPREALRVVSVAMEALQGSAWRIRRAILSWLREGALNEDGIPVVVLAKKTAFTAEEESAVRAHFEQIWRTQLRSICLQARDREADNPFADLIASNDPYRFAQELCLQRGSGHRQRSVFLLHAQSRTNPRPAGAADTESTGR